MRDARIISNVQQHYNLIEDYVQTMKPPIAQDVSNRFVAVQNDLEAMPITELITVSSSNNLLRFYWDRTSNSGWNHEEVCVDGAPSSAITKVVAFYQNGTLYALAHYASAGGADRVLGMERTVESDWSSMPIDRDWVNALGRMRQTDSFRDAQGNQFFYGVSENYTPSTFVILGQRANGQWAAVWLEPVAGATASYRLLPGYGGCQMTVVTLEGPDASFRSGTVVDGIIQWDSKGPVTHDLGQGDLTSQQVFAVPSQTGDQGFLLMGTDQQLLHVSGYEGPSVSVMKLTGGTGQPSGVLTVSAGLDSRNLYMVFAIDTINSRLWLLRQSAASGSVVGFDPWVRLGNVLGAIASPAVMVQGPELFCYDLTANVTHLSQPIAQGNWFTQTVASPAPATADPTPTSTYTSELATVDSAGHGTGGIAMKVYSDRASVLIINGISYHADAATPAEVVTDLSGKVTVSSVCGSLVSPSLTAIVPALGDEIKGPYRSDLRVHERLAGKDSGFPVTGASLKQAGLIAASVDDKDARDLAGTLRSLGQVAVQRQQADAKGLDEFDYELTEIDRACFEVDFTQGQAMCRDLLEEEAVRIFSGAPALSPGDIWGDICNFVKHEIDELEKLCVKVEAGVVHVTMTLADGVRHFALKTLAEIGDCIETFLTAVASIAQKIENAIELAIRWLRMLFEWKDIILTKRVIHYYAEQTLTNLHTDLSSDLPRRLLKEFNSIKSELETTFDNLEKHFAAGRSFNAMVPSSSTNPAARSGPPLELSALHAESGKSSVQCNYVLSKMITGVAGGAPAAALPAPANGVDVSGLVTVFQESFPLQQLEDSWKRIKEFSGHIKGAGSFMDVVVLDLLEATKDLVVLVLSGIEAVLVELSKIAGEAVGGLRSLLDSSIKIPIVSEIYRLFAGSSLTLMDLFSLLIAAPVTILYKLLYGKKPYSDADVSKIESGPIPWPSIPSRYQGGRALPVPGAGPADIVLAIVFMICCWVYTVLDILLDGWAAADYGGDAGLPGLGRDAVVVLVGVAAIFTSVLLQGSGVPWAAMKRINEKKDSPADILSSVFWCMAWLPTILDMVFTAGSDSKKITRFQKDYGPWMSCVAGVIMVQAGAGLAVAMGLDLAHYNPFNMIEALAPQWPFVFQPIVEMGLSSGDGIGLALNAILWLIDYGSDVGMGAAKLLALDFQVPES